jgi:hypothetical protein
VQKSWNLTSLHEICGDVKRTISECKELLAQNREVHRSDSSVYTDEWILVIKPKLEELNQRLRLHVTKLSIVLKPLETKLLGDVRHEFSNANVPADLRQSLPVPPIQGLLVFNIEQTLAEYGQPQPIHLEITTEIEAQIRAILEQAKPELRFTGTLKLKSGLDLFVESLDQSTKSFVPGSFVSDKTPSPKQYINLIKCSMVLQHIQQAQELRQAGNDSLWHVTVAELGSILRSECQRFSVRSQSQLIAPDVASLQRELRGPIESRGSREDVTKIMSPHFETYSQPILAIPLPSPQDGLQRQLSAARIDNNRLRLVETLYENDRSAAPLGEIVMNIDMSTVQMTPIYATPSSRPRPLEVLLHTGTGQLNPSFSEVKHIYRLQHLLTGYKVYDRYDQAMVKVSFFIAGNSTPMEEHGRVQLWLPQPFTAGDRSAPTAKNTPNESSASVIHNPPVLVQDSDSVSTRRRPGSLRNWIPGMRRGSNTNNVASQRHDPAPRAEASPSSQLRSPAVSPIAPQMTLTSPTTFGPFELSAEGSAGVHSSYDGYAASNAMPHAQPGWAPPPYAPHDMDRLASLRPNSVYTTRTSLTDDLPEITQTFPADRRHGYSPYHPQNEPNSPVQASWPYSPESLTPPSQWGEHRGPDIPSQHSRSRTNSNASSAYSDHHTMQSNNPAPATTSRGTPSVVSTRSTRSHSSMASSVSTIKTSTGASSVSSSGLARMHHKPQKPLLVMFLKSRDPSAKLSIVAIQIDSHTSVVRERCDCYNSHSTCRISCIERSKGGSLLAQRWEADSGLTSWNIAKLGENQRKERENLWPNLRRVSLRFQKMEGTLC